MGMGAVERDTDRQALQTDRQRRQATKSTGRQTGFIDRKRKTHGQPRRLADRHYRQKNRGRQTGNQEGWQTYKHNGQKDRESRKATKKAGKHIGIIDRKTGE